VLYCAVRSTAPLFTLPHLRNKAVLYCTVALPTFYLTLALKRARGLVGLDPRHLQVLTLEIAWGETITLHCIARCCVALLNCLFQRRHRPVPAFETWSRNFRLVRRIFRVPGRRSCGGVLEGRGIIHTRLSCAVNCSKLNILMRVSFRADQACLKIFCQL
jgi:hypothetical protein